MYGAWRRQPTNFQGRSIWMRRGISVWWRFCKFGMSVRAFPECKLSKLTLESWAFKKPCMSMSLERKKIAFITIVRAQCLQTNKIIAEKTGKLQTFEPCMFGQIRKGKSIIFKVFEMICSWMKHNQSISLVYAKILHANVKLKFCLILQILQACSNWKLSWLSERLRLLSRSVMY